MTRLTEHFTLEELVKSDTAARLGIDNTPTPEACANLQRLAIEVLEPLRLLLGVPVIVSSGYRCAALNKAVGGMRTSQHQKGQAADLVCTRYEVKRRAFELLKGFDVDQLLWERNQKGTTWIHVSYVSPEKNRNDKRDNYEAK